MVWGSGVQIPNFITVSFSVSSAALPDHDGLVQVFPFSGLVQHRRSIFHLDRIPKIGLPLSAGRNEVALEEKFRALPDQEIMKPDRGMGMRGAARHTDAIGHRNRRRYDEPVDRSALHFGLLRRIAEHRERQRHLAGSN